MKKKNFVKLICLTLSFLFVLLLSSCSSATDNDENGGTTVGINNSAKKEENNANESIVKETPNNKNKVEKKDVVPIVYQEKTESYYYDITYVELCGKIADVLEELCKENNTAFDRASFLSGCTGSEYTNGAYYVNQYGDLIEPGDEGLRYNGTTYDYIVPFEYRNDMATSSLYISVAPETLKIVNIELNVGNADLTNELDPEFMAFADMLINLFCDKDFKKLDKYMVTEYSEGVFGVNEFVCNNSFIKFKYQNTLNATGTVSLYIRPTGEKNGYDKIDSESEAKILSLAEDKENPLINVNGVVCQFSGIYVSDSDFSPNRAANTMNYVRFYDDKIEMNIYLSTGFEVVTASYKVSEDGKSIVLSECKNDSLLVFESGVEFIWPYEGDDISTIEISGSQECFALTDEQLPSQFTDGAAFFVLE
ncbi:MAG: hypothetical protein IJN94_06875 [Clostridia bacterium]|nr:hypothetical protein [Clostridia bacterium]